MKHTDCRICKKYEDDYHYDHDHDEIYSPFFEKLKPVGLEKGDKRYHAKFLNCSVCGTYYFYENWQQGIGNIGEFDDITRFNETDNRFIKPILEAVTAEELLIAVKTGVDQNGYTSEKAQKAFEAAMNMHLFEVLFPTIQFFLTYKKKWQTLYGAPVMQGRVWACSCLRKTIRDDTALSKTEVHQAIFECFRMKIKHTRKGWEQPEDMPIITEDK